jgi:hypothetical protein
MSNLRWIVALIIGLLLGWMLHDLMSAPTLDVATAVGDPAPYVEPPNAHTVPYEIAAPEPSGVEPAQQQDTEPPASTVNPVIPWTSDSGTLEWRRATAEEKAARFDAYGGMPPEAEALLDSVPEAYRAQARESELQAVEWGRALLTADQTPGWSARMRALIEQIYYSTYPYGDSTVDRLHCANGVCVLVLVNQTADVRRYSSTDPYRWCPLTAPRVNFGAIEGRSLDDPGFRVVIYFQEVTFDLPSGDRVSPCQSPG